MKKDVLPLLAVIVFLLAGCGYQENVEMIKERHWEDARKFPLENL